MKLGSVEIEITQDAANQLDIKLKAPGQIARTFRAEPPAGASFSPQRKEYIEPPREPTIKIEPEKDIKMLIHAGFSRKTLAMVVNKVLDIPVRGQTLAKKFHLAEDAALRYLRRPISNDIWAVFIAEVDISDEGQELCAIGLSQKNQLIVLALEKATPEAFFEKLKYRGLDQTQLKLGVLSFRTGAVNAFRTAFPNTELGLDWQEFLTSANDDTLRDVMGFEDREGLERALQDTRAPKELASFMKFDKRLWRALKTTAPVQRLGRDLKSKLRHRAIQSSRQQGLVRAFSIIRLQYHWLKIPVDAPQLRNLKYIQPQAEF